MVTGKDPLLIKTSNFYGTQFDYQHTPTFMMDTLSNKEVNMYSYQVRSDRWL